jgi:GT2 family glycosyltransferase
MNAKPSISIAMAVYNGERFIGQQLENFLKQTRLPDAVVISDNASTDRTVEVASKGHHALARPLEPVVPSPFGGVDLPAKSNAHSLTFLPFTR